jgi:hypothetical protein
MLAGTQFNFRTKKMLTDGRRMRSRGLSVIWSPSGTSCTTRAFIDSLENEK